VLHGTRHVVLLFTGWDEHARPAVELRRLAERIEGAPSRAWSMLASSAPKE
jgi:hypothetical protein